MIPCLPTTQLPSLFTSVAFALGSISIGGPLIIPGDDHTSDVQVGIVSYAFLCGLRKFYHYVLKT